MYKLNDEKMFFDMAEEQAVVIDSTSGVYFGMNMLASKVFEKLVEGASVVKIAEALKKLPSCPQDIEVALDSFVANLLAYEIILSDADVCYDEEIIAEEMWFMEGREFLLDSYEDLIDLISADPVHDVDEEFGWPVLKEEEADE